MVPELTLLYPGIHKIQYQIRARLAILICYSPGWSTDSVCSCVESYSKMWFYYGATDSVTVYLHVIQCYSRGADNFSTLKQQPPTCLYGSTTMQMVNVRHCSCQWVANHVQLLIANCNSSQWSKHIVDRHNSSSGPMQWWSLPHVPPVLSYYSISDVQLHLTGWYTFWYIHYSNCAVNFYISLAAETTASTSVWGHSSLDASWTHALAY